MNFFFQDEIGLKEWALSLRSAHKLSQELLGSIQRKAGKIYGTGERDASMKSTSVNNNITSSGSGNANNSGVGGGGGVGGGVGVGVGVGGGVGGSGSSSALNNQNVAKNTNGN